MTDKCDKFGNPFAPGLPYARGKFISSTADDLAKLKRSWEFIRQRRQTLGQDSIYQLSGLERNLQVDPTDLALMDDEIASAIMDEDIKDAGLKHLGGDAANHDVLLCNRLTAGLLVSADVMISTGDKVIGVSPTYSHPAVVRAVQHGGGVFEDVTGLAEFEKTLSSTPDVKVVMLTRLAVSYEIMSADELARIVALSKKAGAKIIVDDAGGGRVGPAVFDQPHTLELGIDIGITGLDKYGTTGPRLGLLGGDKSLVAKIRSRAYEMGLEARQMLYPAVLRSLRQYRHENVRGLVDNTMCVANALIKTLGKERVTLTPVTVQLRAEDILEIAIQRAGVSNTPLVPYEATAALAMLLLKEHGVISVHFAGIPPGTSALMIKFVPAGTLKRFGGPEKLAHAIDGSLDELANIVDNRMALAELLGVEYKQS